MVKKTRKAKKVKSTAKKKSPARPRRGARKATPKTGSVLAKRIREVQPSATLAITAKAKQMKAEGIDVISFAAGEPDFGTPEHVSEAGIAGIRAGHTRYTPSSGTPELKAAVCEKFRRENGLVYSPAEVLISCGAKHSVYNIVQVLCDRGDEVLVPAPYWVSYPEMIKIAEARIVVLPTDDESEFRITARQLARAITPRTKLLILNSPSNPTGMVYAEEELREIAAVLVKRKIYCISDEIYERLVYGGAKHVSIAEISEKMKALTVVVNGHSKAYAMTGWRIGYAAGPLAVIKAASNLQSHSTSNPAAMCQDAAIAALTGDQGVVETMRVEFEKRRDLIVERLNAIPGVECVRPQGAFYVFPNVSGLYGRRYAGERIDGSMDFARVALAQARIAAIPGVEFGADECARFSYACSTERIVEGMDRLARLAASAE